MANQERCTVKEIWQMYVGMTEINLDGNEVTEYIEEPWRIGSF